MVFHLLEVQKFLDFSLEIIEQPGKVIVFTKIVFSAMSK